MTKLPESRNAGATRIDQFFTALRLRDLERCQSILDQWDAQVDEAASWRTWRRYLQGILLFERDRDFASAEKVFLQVLHETQEPEMQGRAWRALGRSYQVQGRWQEAVEAYRQSLAVFQSLGLPIEQARAWKQMAIATRRGYNQGVFDETALHEALDYCRQAFRALKKADDDSEAALWLEGSIHNTAGAIHFLLQEKEEAIAAYQRDLSICQRLHDRHGMGLTLGNLGEVYLMQSAPDWEKAQEAFEQALALISEFGNIYEEIEALANLAYFFQQKKDLDGAAAHYALAVNRIESLRTKISSTEVRQGFFGTMEDIYAHLVLVHLERGDIISAFNITEQARSRSLLDSFLAHGDVVPSDLEAKPRKLDEVQQALPEDAVLLAYFTTGLIEHPDERIRAQRLAQRHRFPPARIGLFAITRDDIRAYDTGLSPNLLLPRRIDRVAERHFLNRGMLRSLYRFLIAPVEDLWRGKRMLYLVPHGPLHYLPFHAFIASDGRPLLRRDGPHIAYSPSASALLTPSSVPAPSSCLAWGYDIQGDSQLRFSEREARLIAHLTDGVAITGEAGDKAWLMQASRRYHMLHFSCHGEFLSDAPLNSYLQLNADSRLTAREVFNLMELQAALVVMSACESGLSRVRKGDELIGFPTSFLHAGAKAVMASLWRVDEVSTLLLMQEFYRKLMSGLHPAAALHGAQLFLQSLTGAEVSQMLGESTRYRREERPFSHPFYWAPFVLFLSGENRSHAQLPGA